MTGTVGRERNFNENEKSFLTSLVAKHKDVLECKITNKTSVQKKEAEWNDLAREYNAEAMHRTHEQFNNKTSIGTRSYRALKKCWENMKRGSKNEFAEERTQVFTTGGGTNDVVVSEEASQVYNIIQVQIDPLVNQYDDDAVPASCSSAASNAVSLPSSSSAPGTGNPRKDIGFPLPKTFKRKLPEIHHGSKRSAQDVILDKAEAEYEKKISILEKESILMDRKIQLTNLKIEFMQKRLHENLP